MHNSNKYIWRLNKVIYLFVIYFILFIFLFKGAVAYSLQQVNTQ